MKNSEDLALISKKILSKTKYEAEVFISKSTSLKINILNQKVESIDNGTTFEIGIRLIKDKRLGFAYGCYDDIDCLSGQALKNASYMPQDQFNSFPQRQEYSSSVSLYDEEIDRISLDEKIEKAREIESCAYKFDTRITKTESVSYFESGSQIHIANSKGINASYVSNNCGGYAQIICEDKGQMEEGFWVEAKKHWKDLNAVRIGEKAAKTAVSLFGGRLIKSDALPVIFNTLVASEFVQIIAHALSADEIQKGKSRFREQIGKVVANNINVIDDGTLKGGLFSAPFDDEGVKSRQTYLIKDGILQNYLYNTYTANKDNRQSSANAKRASGKSLPGIGTTNFYIEAGKESHKELFNKVEKGIYVTRVMAMHSVNHISGDFSVGAAGIMIENGKKTFPVRGITIAGNIYEMLHQIGGLSADLEFHLISGNCGSPTLLINQLSISGE